jgi:hemolysin D
VEKSTQNEVPGEIGGPVATVPMALTREADFKRLVGEGFISSRATQDKTRVRVELERDLASQRERQTQLTASVAGIIQHLAIHSVGGVVTSAQPLMIVVPDSPMVTAEITVANQDISLVYAGQRRRSSWKPFRLSNTAP